MKWILFDFKSAKEPWFDETEATYLKKINHFIKFEIVHLKTKSADREQAASKIKFEESVLLEKLSDDDYIIAFDEAGKTNNSVEFSQTILKAQESGKKRCVLLVGGAYGLGESVKSKAHKKLSLSQLTMNHLIAEAVILEQFYRAQTILNRIPYHNI